MNLNSKNAQNNYLLRILPALPCTANSDFIHVSKDMTFDPSAGPRDRRCVEVELVDNQLVEQEERFSVVLSSPLEGRGVLLDPKTVHITITDTDGTSLSPCALTVHVDMHTFIYVV